VYQFNDIGTDYYAQRSISYKEISYINIPLLIIHSKDDAFIAKNTIPFEQIKKNENIAYILTDHGFHCCHIKSSINLFDKDTIFFSKRDFSWIDEIGN
jgi:predicted alpha/beta-fold hydrolase